MSAQFTGFPLGTRDFFKGLSENNTRQWFEENKPFYTDRILPAAQSFVQDLGERLQEIAPGIIADTRLNGSGSIFRIYRDVRFSRDKTPYKTYMGIFWWQGSHKKMESSGFYFHLEHDRLFLYTGLNFFTRQALSAYREYLQNEEHSDALADALKKVKKRGYKVGGERYKRFPRDYDKEMKNADLMLYKGLHAVLEDPIPDEFYVKGLVDICYEHFHQMAPLHHWLHQMLETNPPA